jgi:hypothetical protein
MHRPPLVGAVLPGVVIAGALLWSYTEPRLDGGIEVRAVATSGCPGGRSACPRAAYVRITKPGLRDTLAGGRIARSDSVRFRLQAGSYVVRPAASGRLRARPVRVYVPREGFVRVVVRFEPLRRGSGR